LPILWRSQPPRGYSPSGRAVAGYSPLSCLSAAPGYLAARVPLARSMARAKPCALLALACAKAPSPTARRLTGERGLHRVFGFRSCRRCRSSTIVDEVLSVLGCRPLMLVRWRLLLRPWRAHSDCRADSHGAPIPRAHGRGGPHFPSCSSPACFARARQGAGGLRESGVRLWRAFFSAAANEPIGRLSLLLRVRFDCPVGGGVGRS
jgi:hypothetical protein